LADTPCAGGIENRNASSGMARSLRDLTRSMPCAWRGAGSRWKSNRTSP